MKDKCYVCKVLCNISKEKEQKSCAFEYNGDENICPFDARYLDLSEHDKQIRAEVVEECAERVDRLMVNTICNPKLKTTEQIDIYLQCIRDVKRVISGKNIIKGEEDDNN